jgi:hypothetical protein
MKRIATMTANVALMLNLGVAGIYAQQGPVKMTVSGTNVSTTIDLAPGTITDEVNFGGNGTLGPFTYRELHADALSPQSSSGCVHGTGLYIPTMAGAGVFRFQDGSLLTVALTEGALCIDPAAGVANYTGTYKITGGTGRFKSASGALTLNSAVSPVGFSASGAPVLFTNAGEFAGQVSGVAIGEDGQNERQ